MPATSNHHATRLVLQSVSFLIADSVRMMISYPWLTGAYRSSGSAYCGRLIERFGVALPVISLGTARERSCRLRDRRLFKGHSEDPDVTLLPNPAVYENKGGAVPASEVALI
jgi:hypothetical protein